MNRRYLLSISSILSAESEVFKDANVVMEI